MDSKAWDDRYAAADLVWSAEPNRWVVETFADKPATGRAYDIATGEGRNALWLAERGWDVTAVDFSEQGLATARRLHAGHPHADRLRVTWVHGDVLHHPPAPRSCAAVVVAYLHLPPPERRQVVRGAANGLQVGGTLLVVGHDSSNLAEGVGGPQDPAVLFTAADVVGDLAGMDGLEVRRAERVQRPVAADDGERVAQDALVEVLRTA